MTTWKKLLPHLGKLFTQGNENNNVSNSISFSPLEIFLNRAAGEVTASGNLANGFFLFEGVAGMRRNTHLRREARRV